MIKHYKKIADISENRYSYDTDSITLTLREGGLFLREYIEFRNLTCKEFLIPLKIEYTLNGEEFYLSSGQDRLLSLYTNIEDAVHNVNKLGIKNKFLLILLDEPESSMHPEMQMNFIKKLVEHLLIYKDFRFQIIITSHSPIMTSDLTSNHVLFLKRDSADNIIVVADEKKPKTFAQNIYTLYRESFFLDGVVVGKYANDLIMRIVAELKDKKDLSNRRDYINFIINEIGEPIIQQQLINLKDKDRITHLLDKLNTQNIDSSLKEELITLIIKGGDPNDRY